LSWLYISITKDVRDIVRAPKATSYRVWTAIHEQFRDNEFHRAVYLEAEFRNLVQGDMDITQYTGRLKQLADALRDVGQPIRETSQQVLNMLHGLSSKYRHAISTIMSKQPPHTFFSARSYLLLEEQYDKEHAKSAAQHALLTTGGPHPTAPTSTDSGSNSTTNSGSSSATTAPKSSGGSHGASNRQDTRCGRGRGRGRGHHPGSSSSPWPPTSWTPGQNQWTGLVHAMACPSCWCPRSSSGSSPHQAYFADQPSFSSGITPPPPPMDPWNHQALLAALNATNSSATPPQPAEWFMDMSSNAGNLFSPTPGYNSPPITVGNGAALPVTHRSSTIIPTSRTPLFLSNVLVSPSLVKNLVSVCSLTCDNNVSVEFDAFGFSVKVPLLSRTSFLFVH